MTHSPIVIVDIVAVVDEISFVLVKVLFFTRLSRLHSLQIKVRAGRATLT
jgi:hypothetical protein